MIKTLRLLFKGVPPNETSMIVLEYLLHVFYFTNKVTTLK